MGTARWILGWALGLGFAAGAMAQDRVQIQYAEPVVLTAAPGTSSFDAFGQRFSLLVETNDRLLNSLPAARKATLGTIQLLRGTLAGVPGSWVRLTREGSRIAGAIWDGTDLYVIARHDEVASHLTTPLAVGDLQAVMYRLSDTRNVLPANFCATQPGSGGTASASGLSQFKAMVAELKLQFVAAPTDQLDISLIADAALQQIYSSPNNNLSLSMLNTLNEVDGIYDAQLGLMIHASDLRMAPITGDPFTSTDASTLLGQLRTYRSSIPEVQSKPVAHLFTGRQLDSGVLGIARLGGACSAADGVSLTSIGLSGLQFASALIMAHEIGHNLNAEHDTGACGSTFLMWPEYSWSTTPKFSQCSLDQMRPFIEAHRGSCIVSPAWADAIPRVGSIANPLRTEPFVWPVYLRNAGTAPLLDAIANIDIPGGTAVNTVATTHGACTPQGSTMHCEFGTIPAGVEARVDLNLTSNYIGPTEMRAYAGASNDRYDNNNMASGNVDVKPPAVLHMTVTPATTSALVGEEIPYTVNITSSGARDARAVRLVIFNGSYVQVVSAEGSQGTCYTTECQLGDIPAGSSATVTIRAKAMQGGRSGYSLQLQSGNAYTDTYDVYTVINATATFDLAIDAGPEYRVIAAGAPYEFVVPVRANGTRPVIGGLFRMNSGGGTFLSADVDGVACAREQLFSAQGGGCPLGTLNPGEQKWVRVRLQFDRMGSTGVYMTAEILNDELWANNSANLTLQVRAETDVSIGAQFSGAGNTERQNFEVTASVRSGGANASSNVAAVFEVPVGVRILSATLPQATCALNGDRKVTCTRATMPANEQQQMTVTLQGDEPAMYTGKFSVTADNDGVPTNNSSDLSIYIGPSTDVTLNPIPALPGFVINQPREFNVEVVANLTRPAENVVVTFPTTQSIVLEAVTTPVGTCDVSGSLPHCDLGTLAPGTTVRLVPRYRAISGGGMSGWISVQAMRDVNQSNNSRSVTMNAYEAGDIEIRVASASSSATVGTLLTLPRITLNTITRSQDVLIDIPLPEFAAIYTISFGAGICTGTKPLQCYMSDRASGSSDSIDITLQLNSTGTFTSNLKVRGANDTNAANDSATLQIRSDAVSGSSSSSSSSSSGGGESKGGGGGALDGLWLAVLAAFLGFRRRMTHAL